MNPGDARTSLPKTAAILVPAWLVFVWLMFVPNWHPWALMSNMLPVIPMDFLAGLIRLYRDGLAAAGVLAVVSLAALGAGGLMLRPLGLDIGRGQRLTLSFGLGLAALSYLTFFIGVARHYDSAGRAVAWAALLSCSAAGAIMLARMLRGGVSKGRTGWSGVLFIALLVVVGLFLASKALRPAVFYDAVTYHLGVPNYYLQEGGIGYIPYDSYSNFPFMAEMLYTLGMFVSGLKAAQLTSVAVFVAGALLVYDFTRSFLPEVPPGLPALFFLTTPAFMECSVLYSNDLHLAYYSLLAVYCYFAYERHGGTSWLVLMGLFTGICIGTKYIALVSVAVPAFLAAVYIAYRGRSEGGYHVLRTVTAFAVPAAAAASPWLVKNLVYTGNPFYPAFYGVFGGADMTKALYAVHKMNHPTALGGLKGLVTHPWNLFMAKPAYLTEKYRAASYLGPVVPALLPVIAVIRGHGRAVRILFAYAGLLFFMWSFAFPLTRYLYPAVAVLFIIGSYAMARVWSESGSMQRAVVILAVTACLAFNACLGFYLVDQWTNAYGLAHVDETDAQYLERRMNDGGGVMLTSMPAYRYVNEKAPEDARVLIIGDAQHLYINRRHQYTYLSARTPYDIFGEVQGDTAKAYKRLKDEGITYVVYNPGELRRLSRAGFVKKATDETRWIEAFLMSGYAIPVGRYDIRGNQVFLFELK